VRTLTSIALVAIIGGIVLSLFTDVLPPDISNFFRTAANQVIDTVRVVVSLPAGGGEYFMLMPR
jgi:hypothetical protein